MPSEHFRTANRATGGSSVLSIVLFTLVALLAWTGLVAAAAFNTWGRAPIALPGDVQAFLDAAGARLDAHAGNGIIALLEDGRVVGLHAQSRGGTVVDGDSLFQVASLSKWVTAWGVMTLVDRGRIDLDAPVSRYLTRWRLPQSPYDDQVTVRRLLSHTAGLTDGLGYRGFAPGETPQTLEASLTHAADALPGRDGRVRVGYEPGTDWSYSGGGYTLLQLLIEEVSGEPFNDYMRRAVLIPLGMTHSTYVLDDASRAAVVPFYDGAGQPATHYTFTALAAASLYTSANDLARFFAAQRVGADGAPPGRGVLRPQTLAAIRAAEGRKYGFDIWGLGVIRYGPNRSGGGVIGHEGGNYPAINTSARLDPDTGDGVIVMETGDGSLASAIGNEWVVWKFGRIGFPVIVAEGMRYVVIHAIGAGVIVLGAILAALFRRRRKAA